MEKVLSSRDKEYEFDLVGNAKDSLEHAIEHFTLDSRPTPSDIKRSVLDVTHVVELILKERLKRVSPALIWKNVDQYPDEDKNTVDIKTAKMRLEKIAGIVFTKAQSDRIENARLLRNRIMHYQFVINKNAAIGIVGGMLSFIFDFSKRELNLDWEKEFRSDGTWVSLTNIFEFCEEHWKVVLDRITSEGGLVIECPQCGWATYSIFDDECKLCEHHAYVKECHLCGEFTPGSLLHEVKRIMEDKDGGKYSADVEVCDNCFSSMSSNRIMHMKGGDYFFDGSDEDEN